MMEEGLVDDILCGFPCEFQIEPDKEFFPPCHLDGTQGIRKHGGVEHLFVEVFSDEHVGFYVVYGEAVVMDFVLYVHDG